MDRTRESPSSDSYTPKASSPRGSRRSTRRGQVRGSCFSLSCEYSFPKSTTFEHNIVECNARTQRRRLKRMLRRRSSISSKSISFPSLPRFHSHAQGVSPAAAVETFGKRCAASDTFTDKCIRQKKTPRRASSWRDSLAGVPFPCISRVSPVHTSGVWLTRNLPPQRISILTFIIRQCLYGCKALFYSVNIYSISSH